MKKVIFSLVLFSMVACQGDKLDLQSEGTITKRDYRKCYCCGGWFIEIDGETYLADLSGEQTTALNLQENALPVQVELNWKKDENACLDNKITVTDIKRQ